MFSVPIIPFDLRHEETVIQVAISFDILQKTINSVFHRIDARIERNNVKVHELRDRIQTAQVKIQHNLRGSKKAIKIYSPAHFPDIILKKIFREIPATFEPSNMCDNVEGKPIQSEAVDYIVNNRVDSLASMAEKLVFFHVRTTHQISQTPGSSNGTVKVAGQKLQKNSNMGAVPHNLRSTNSLLYFKSNDPVYGVLEEEDDDFNAWKRAKMFKNQRHQNRILHNRGLMRKQQLLEPAPHSLLNRNQKQLTPSGGLRYTPILTEAPELNLPSDLPDLPGIANDIHYEGHERQQIAPSLYIKNLPDVPEIEEGTNASEEEAALQDATDLKVTKGVTDIPRTMERQKTELVTLLPPPPSQTVIAVIEPVIDDVPLNMTISKVPPPPPPLPPPAPVAPKAPVNQMQSQTQSIDQTDSHSQLMDAIRKAGGAQGGRLKNPSAAAPLNSEKYTSSASIKNRGGDLMADLHNKLITRRKGISGAVDNANKINNNYTNDAIASGSGASIGSAVFVNPVISRLSALIPPPKPSEVYYDNTNDDENDADWND